MIVLLLFWLRLGEGEVEVVVEGLLFSFSVGLVAGEGGGKITCRLFKWLLLLLLLLG